MSTRFLYFPAVASETVLDTYTQVGQWVWRSGNAWWNVVDKGTWSSTSSNVGTYLALDSGSQIRTTFVNFSANDPGGWPTNAKIRLTVAPSSGGPATAVEGSAAGAGDSRWFWRDASGGLLTLTAAQIGDGGTFGWDSSDTFTIQIFTP